MIILNRFLFIFSALFVSLLKAQPESINFIHFNVKNGLSQNSVYAILQDSRGFLWLGTKDGLNKYDGYSFKEYKNNPNNPQSISDNFIRSIYEDPQGHLWIGTEYGSLNLYDREKDAVIPIQIKTESLNNVKSIFTMVGDSKNNLWLCTRDNGIIKFNLSTNTFTQATFNSSSGTAFPYIHAQSFLLEKNDILWVGFSDFTGLARVNLKTNQFNIFKQKPLHTSADSRNSIYSIYRSKAGELWLATVNGLVHFNESNSTFKHFPLMAGKEYTYIKAIVEDDLGYLWLSTSQYGLCKFNPKTNQFILYKTHDVKRHLFEQIELATIYRDRTGSTWVGSNGEGVSKFHPNKKFKSYLYSKAQFSILSANSVRAISLKNNILWVGDYGGLSRYDRNTDNLTYYQYDPKNPKSIQNNNIYSILIDHNNQTWVGTEGDGLFHFSSIDGSFSSAYKIKNSDTKFVYELYEDSKNTIWVGTYGGLLKAQNGKSRTFEQTKVLQGKAVFAIHEDNLTNIWVGTEKNGIFIFNLDGKLLQTFTHDIKNFDSISSNKIKTIYKDKRGTIWIGTNGGGLNKYNEDTQTFSHVTTENGLPNNVVYGILEDANENLWLSTNIGIAKLSLKDYSVKIYTADDGLQSNEFNTGAYFQSNDGEIFFGGINGLNSFYPDQVTDNTIVPKIQITDFKLENRPVTIGQLDDGRTLIKKNISEIDSLVLNYSNNIISFEFSSLSFNSPEKNRYAYKLVNFIDDWVYTDSKNRIATFTNLEPGHYSFIVKGSNEDGIWNTEGKLIDIHILPPYWATWWAYVIYIFLFLSCLTGFIKWRTYTAKKITIYLKEKVEEKTKELNLQTIEIQEQYDLISGVIESLSDPFYVVDAQQGKTVFENSAAKESPLKSKLDEFMTIRGQVVSEVIETNKPILKEMTYTSDNGKLIDLEISAYPVRNKKGRITQVIKYWKNISDRKALERSKELHLQVQSNELKSKILHASNLRDQLSKISNAIEVEAKKTATSKDIFGKINERLKKLITAEKDEFYFWYSEENKDFFARLKQRSKSLTKRQLRICSLLRLNLNTKEIAEIFQLSAKTVEVYRSQIRIKLNIPKDDNLNKFFSEF